MDVLHAQAISSMDELASAGLSWGGQALGPAPDLEGVDTCKAKSLQQASSPMRVYDGAL